ncbi:hypothetical protein AB0F09_18695 [Streptomyces olivaceus]|uniref:hypothetical protein n=1 Tax=Streptomyces olivaceus TaxID=47716 RepID=UPI00340ADA75
MKIFGREPALIITGVSAGLSLLVTFGFGLSAEQAGAIVAYGLDLSTEKIGALNAVVLAGLALLTRGQVTPSSPSTPATAELSRTV